MKDNSTTCEWALDRIDGYLDNDLDEAERARFVRHVSACGACTRELAFAQRVRAELHALPSFEAPARAVEAAARASGSATLLPNVVPLPDRRRPSRLRWAAAAAAVLVLVLSGLWFEARKRGGGYRGELARAGVTEAEVAQASAEVALAFGYVGKYSERAAEVLYDDVLEQRVVPRVGQALKASREAAVDGAIVPGLRRAAREAGFDVTPADPGRS